MIRASVYGRLGGDPIERTTKSGKTMTTASLAVSVNRHGEDDLTEWVGLVAFGTVGEQLLRHGRGDLLAAMGTLTKRRFTGRDGVEREQWSLTADAIVSARTVRPGGRKRSAKGDGASAPASGERAFEDDVPKFV